ncbi:2-keto-4-pentenoate hydratase [Xylophilus sp. ASV27]|uniref:2-keto-4-pentenoate hydratase n=1 Tax=Xylophilus sp. ASV27 TaxID=2795129 RepID=UPI0018EABDBC|nr:fumarylacetoacetate hydrolase family protein [Xylophilus sp. ASV27]
MSESNSRLAIVAKTLDTAAHQARAVDQFPAGHFTLPEAYEIQRASIARRVSRGEEMVGIKLGFTSRAKMIQMGVDSLIWGLLTDDMLEEEGAVVSLSRFIHPRVEPEVCFITKRTIDGPLTALEAVEHIEAVAPAMEIIDSRYRNFKFTLEDVIADNCSSAGLVVGAWSRNFDALTNAGVRMQIDGRNAQVGSTAAILGQPLRSIVQVSRLLSAAEMGLPAGSLIMAGAATAAEALRPGTTVECHIGSGSTALGSAMFHTAAAA